MVLVLCSKVFVETFSYNFLITKQRFYVSFSALYLVAHCLSSCHKKAIKAL